MLRATIWLLCNLLRCGVGNGAVAAEALAGVPSHRCYRANSATEVDEKTFVLIDDVGLVA
jgi:hypothetical protein